jgi:hypothetical protein
MKDLFLLVDAFCEAYDRVYHPVAKGDPPPFQPRDGMTFCNQGVWYVVEKFGYRGFSGLTANQMIDVMRSSLDWRPLPMEEAQNHANQGSVVVAGLQDHPHGHVCVVRPGHPGTSGKWGRPVPKVANIGAQNFIARGVNYVFKDPPEFFVLAASL